MRKIILNHLFFLVIAGVIFYKGITAPDLNWNMFLALVAYDAAVLTYFISNRWFAILSAIVWLAFFRIPIYAFVSCASKARHIKLFSLYDGLFSILGSIRFQIYNLLSILIEFARPVVK